MASGAHQHCSRLRAAPLAFVLFLARLSHADAPAPRLTEARSEHFVLYTDLGQRDARSLSRSLEDAYAVLWRLIFRTAKDPEMHAIVLVVRDDDLFDRLRPDVSGSSRESVRGFLDSDESASLLVASLGTGRSPVLKSTLHELGHLFINQAIPFRPPWVSEGLAEYLATLEVDGTDLKLGKVPEDRSAVLSRSPLIPLEELMAFTKEDELTQSPRRADMAYAESWGLVHFLIHGDDGRFRRPFEDYLADLSRGQDARLLPRLPVSLDTLKQDFRFYVKRGLYRFRTVSAATIERDPACAVRPLSASDAEAVIAFVIMRGGDLDAAARALPARTELPLGALVRARSSAAKGDLGGALAALDAAIALHPSDPLLLLERERLLGDPEIAAIAPGRARQRRADLEDLLAEAPWLAAAVHDRARLLLAEGEPKAALADARRAVALRGGEAFYYHTLSQALAASGNTEGAIDVERRALPLARTDRVRAIMEGHLDKLGWKR